MLVTDRFKLATWLHITVQTYESTKPYAVRVYYTNKTHSYELKEPSLGVPKTHRTIPILCKGVN
jgi:hypothetical protein